MTAYYGASPLPRCEDYCPNRGPALPHAHGSECGDEHPKDVCCHCGQRFQHAQGCKHSREDKEARESSPTADEVEPPLDVAQRLKDIGATDDDTPREPKLVTGTLTGPVWGRGRGELTERDKRQLIFNCDIARDGHS